MYLASCFCASSSRTLPLCRAPASHPITAQATGICLFIHYNDFLSFLFQCPGEAGASRPRSVKNKSSGPPVKMASKAANPVTLGKKQKKSLFLCNGHPRRSLTMRGASAGHQRGAKGNTSSYFLSIFSWCFSLCPSPPHPPSPKLKQIHLSVIKAHVWSSPNP